MQERLLPFNNEAEQSVLGAMFLSKYALQKALEVLTPDIFHNNANSLIFKAIESLNEKNIPLDLTTLTAELDSKKELNKVGGVSYLTEIVNIVPSAANIDEYIRIIEEKATLRRLIEEATLILNNSYNSSADLSEILEDAEKKILNVVKTRKGTEFRKIQEVLTKTQSDIEALSQLKGDITGLSTGFKEIDMLTAGLHPGELIIIAARPAMGKTAFAVNLGVNMAINSGLPIAIFNLEMSAEQLTNRMLSSVGQIELNKLKTGKLTNNDWKRLNEAISKLAETKIFIDDSPGKTITEIRAKCRRLASEQEKIGAIIIDYLQLIDGTNKFGANRQQEVAEISRSLKTLALELEVPVIALSQLSRKVEDREDKRPLLSDLRESGSIEQDADIVAFLHREDYYKPSEAIDEVTSKSEFIVAKHRNGPTKIIDLIFKRNTSTFVNFTSDEP
jgi:replicative DNA helicase